MHRQKYCQYVPQWAIGQDPQFNKGRHLLLFYTYTDEGAWIQAGKLMHRADKKCDNSFHFLTKKKRKYSQYIKIAHKYIYLYTYIHIYIYIHMKEYCVAVTWNTTLDFSRRYVLRFAPIILYLLSKLISVYFPNRLLLSFRVVFALPIALENKSKC